MIPSSQPISEVIGERVRQRRLESGLSESSIARVLGCTESELQAAERGEAQFTAEQLYELCTVLRVQPSWFFDGLEELG